MLVNLINQSGIKKITPTGFSWTCFFFGPFVPLFRGDAKWALIFFVAAICTYGISNLVICFIYNNLYIKTLLEEGYKPASDEDKQILINSGISA